MKYVCLCLVLCSMNCLVDCETHSWNMYGSVLCCVPVEVSLVPRLFTKSGTNYKQHGDVLQRSASPLQSKRPVRPAWLWPELGYTCSQAVFQHSTDRLGWAVLSCPLHKLVISVSTYVQRKINVTSYFKEIQNYANRKEDRKMIKLKMWNVHTVRESNGRNDRELFHH